MIRYVLAMHVPAWARALNLPLTLEQLQAAGFAAQPLASGPAAVGPRTSPSGAPAAGQRQVAITFDDGPHPEGTPRMLETLAEHRATATFFVVGEQVVKRPALARLIVSQGHVIGLHGYQHRPHLLRAAASWPRTSRAGSPRSRMRPGRRRACTARRSGSTAPRACGSRANAACSRCCGRSGARTGARSPPPSRSPRGHSMACAPAT